MPLSTLFVAGPVKIGAAIAGAALLGVGGYAAYDHYAHASPYDRPLPLLPEARVGLFEPAPAVQALPAVAPARVGYIADADASYAWAERASALSYAFADVPPDYGYGYDGSEYWAWESEDGWVLDIEPVYAGDRYYYYGPGADYPFFIRDAGYGYGFDGGVLVVIYDSYGRLMPRDYVRSRADWAGRYLYRAALLRQARLDAARENRRWRIRRDRWEARQVGFARQQARLEQAALRQADWRAYRARVDNRERRYFANERRERLQAARRVQADWRRDEVRQARRSTDAPPSLTVAERRRLASADELVDRGSVRRALIEQRAQRAERVRAAAPERPLRAMARDENRAEVRRQAVADRRNAAKADRPVLAAAREAREERPQAVRQAVAERRAAAAREPARPAALDRQNDRAKVRADTVRAQRAERAVVRPQAEARRQAVAERVRAEPARQVRPERVRPERVRPERVRPERAAATARPERPQARAVQPDRAAARAARLQARQERKGGD